MSVNVWDGISQYEGDCGEGVMQFNAESRSFAGETFFGLQYFSDAMETLQHTLLHSHSPRCAAVPLQGQGVREGSDWPRALKNAVQRGVQTQGGAGKLTDFQLRIAVRVHQFRQRYRYLGAFAFAGLHINGAS